MHLRLSPIGGLAGDMLCAGLLDARPDLLPAVREAVASLNMPVPVRIELEEAGGEFRGRRFRVIPEPRSQPHHTPYAEIRHLLEQAPLGNGVRDRALRIFGLLSEAEGRVHGVDPEAVSFHEVGSWDSIADIVSAATLLERLGIGSASCAPLPLGRGLVQTAHGPLPVPAPATLLLLEGLPVVDDGIPGERVTPTGAAILRSLNPSSDVACAGTLTGSGLGFGSRILPGIPNCVQALLIAPLSDRSQQPANTRAETDEVVALSFEVDDQSPEDFAQAMDRLRVLGGVLSVTTFTGIGKAGRPTLRVELLAQPSHLGRLAEACFIETTTLGLRWQILSRFVLPRRQQSVDLEDRTLEVKVADRPGGATAKVEARALKGIGGHENRERLRRRGAAGALEEEPDGG